MDIKAVLHILGALLFFLGLSLIFPIAFSLYYGDGDHLALLLALLVTTSIGALTWKLTPANRPLRIREGFAVVTFGWIFYAGFGTLPFLFADVGLSLTDAFFETMSGFTTTGATILEDVEALPHGLLFWRSLTHWLGGMGIIVLSLAILPMLGVGGMQLFKAEVPGPVVDKLQPRIQDTAKLLWGVYVVFSAAETLLLMAGGLSLFDALCQTFGTMATGGFSTRTAGIAAFNSAYVEYVITLFMLLAGINFALHYKALTGQIGSYLKSAELRFYLGIVGVVTLILFINVRLTHFGESFEAFRKAVFQVVSLVTTTGFHTYDYETWSASAQIMLVMLMFVGGCAGSTGGGPKVIRILLVVKHIGVQLRSALHPNAVIPLRIDGRSVPRETLADILGFLLVYVAIFALATLIMSFLGLDLITSVSSVISTLGNIGPGIGAIGPTENYAHIPVIGKWVLSCLMLLGRLEIFSVLVILNRDFWIR